MNPESDLFTFYETAEDNNSCQRKTNDAVHTYHIKHNCCSASPQNNEQDFEWINLQHKSYQNVGYQSQ